MARLEPRQPCLLGRRDIISRAARWVLFGTTAGGLALAVRTLWPRAGRASGLRLDAGRPESFARGEVRGSLLRDSVWVVRSATGFYALSARCPHLGCRLRFLAAERQFQCPCHASTFSIEGAVLRGPAARDMERLFIELAPDGMLRVDPGVRYRREQGEWHRPGAFVSLGSPR